MTRALSLGLAALAAVWLAGCASQLPVATTYDMKPQQTMQAAQHWDVLASDVAQGVKEAVEVRGDLKDIPIYVTPPTERPFSQSFYEMLTSQLVSRGLQVSTKDPTGLTLEYKVLTVRHKDRFQRPPMGTFAALPLGIIAARALDADDLLAVALGAGILADVAVGYVGETSDHEVIITTALSYNNRYVTHQSSFYYISDENWAQYGEPLGLKRHAGVPVRAANE